MISVALRGMATRRLRTILTAVAANVFDVLASAPH
jgi:hypothetical protein